MTPDEIVAEMQERPDPDALIGWIEEQIVAERSDGICRTLDVYRQDEILDAITAYRGARYTSSDSAGLTKGTNDG